EAQPVMAGKKVFQEKLNQISAAFKDHTAIEYGTHTITYAQLDKRSNYIAHWLKKRGIERQAFIGILIDNRIDLLTTVLGIIKAGCVIVPLDSSYPDNRLETMIRITRMGLVFTDKTNSDRFAENPVIKKQDVELRPLQSLFLNDSLNPSWFLDQPDVRYDAQDRLYLLFTSGTTGTPKAIMGRNSGLLHFI
ncbi:MAG: AMP-binding protein, partial [bacterium]|nr:AMP-binding protein [bacterium]